MMSKAMHFFTGGHAQISRAASLAAFVGRDSRTADAATKRYSANVVASFEFVGDEFADLFAQSDATAFQSGAFLDAFYRMIAPAARLRPVIVCVNCELTGRLEMVLPLVLRTVGGFKTIEGADGGVADSFAAIMRSGFRQVLSVDTNLQRQIRSALPAHNLLVLRKVRKEHRVLFELFPGATIDEMDVGTHDVAISSPIDRWMHNTLSAKFRQNLRREGGKLEAVGKVTFGYVETEQELENCLSRLLEMRSARYPDDILQKVEIFAFYRNLAIKGLQDQSVRVFWLKLDDEVIAVEYGLVQQGRFVMLVGSADFCEYGKFGPGKQITIRLLEHCAKAGLSVADFSIGDEKYKKDFGATRRPLYRLRAANGVSGWMANGLYLPLKHLRDWVSERFGRSW